MSAISFPYVASPPTTDPAERLRESEIQNRHLRAIVAGLDGLAARDQLITELMQPADC